MVAKQLPGDTFRQAVANTATSPLSIVGAINAYSALQATQAGHQALYLSGAGVANASLGLPDLGISTCHDVVTDAARITEVTDLPLLVDIDTGWGDAFSIARAIKQLERAGVAAVHLEDQVQQKRCGHRPNKQLVDTAEMVDRIKAAVDAREQNLVVMARTDAFANEGLDGTLERIARYQDAGAEMIFPEALTTLEQYQQISSASSLPVLANITEFGQTPLFTQQELHSVGVKMVLYPLSAFRAMAKAAASVYQEIIDKGSQQGVTPMMQTRDELYQVLDYLRFEQQVDKEKA